jgi:hypothetical protein
MRKAVPAGEADLGFSNCLNCSLTFSAYCAMVPDPPVTPPNEVKNLSLCKGFTRAPIAVLITSVD